MTDENKTKDNVDESATSQNFENMPPPLDLSSLFLPFYTQALIKLGLIADSETQKEEINLELAKRMIDLLDLFKEKTKGNLTPEEDKVLTGSISQLKMTYMEKAEVIKI